AVEGALVVLCFPGFLLTKAGLIPRGLPRRLIAPIACEGERNGKTVCGLLKKHIKLYHNEPV
ncbi:MAG: hypothetical protein LBS37_03765, partial [Treponema sp.]|nr:hypothetical protein [Treponema sp.]